MSGGIIGTSLSALRRRRFYTHALMSDFSLRPGASGKRETENSSDLVRHADYQRYRGTFSEKGWRDGAR